MYKVNYEILCIIYSGLKEFNETSFFVLHFFNSSLNYFHELAFGVDASSIFDSREKGGILQSNA